MKLNQALAIEKGEKSRGYAAISDLHKKAQKPELFTGFAKTYRKLDEDGEDFPPQGQLVQMNAEDVLRQATEAMTGFFDIEATKDWTNTVARADVVVDDIVLISNAPPTFLLFLEKQLSDLRTFVGKLPVLDSAESWTLDGNSNLYKTKTISTHKTKKTPKVIVKYAATTEHPAQTELIYMDEVVGYWDTIKQSGAIPAPRKRELLDRIDTLTKAVKTAREEANNVDCEKKSPASAIFSHLFA